MRASLALGAGRGPRLAVLETLKRHPQGLSVTDLSRELGMSYMGIKAHCVALEKSGHLETHRGISCKGRPRLLHRLTEAGEDLFRESGGDLALDLLREASGLFGQNAPQKLLAMYFRSLATSYRAKIGVGDLMRRVEVFVRIRDAEGRIASLDCLRGIVICECHDPLAVLRRSYPGIDSMEEAMIAEVLEAEVIRSQEEGMIHYRIG